MRGNICGAIIALSFVSNLNAQETMLNVEEWRSAIQVIALAREKIDHEGWYQVEPVGSKECLATALEKSWLQLEKSLVVWDYTKRAVNVAIEAPPLPTLSSDGDPLSIPYWGRYYVYWNDAHGRTKEEILEALDSAIKFARGEEHRALDIGVTGDQLIAYDIQMMDQLNLAISDQFR